MPLTDSKLSELPTRKGFRQRGLATTRIETFTDAAFAFALTLLVLATDIPSSYDQLIAALMGIPAFLISATLLMMFWLGHHTWSRRYGLDDGLTILLSCLLVFTVLVYVYPLRFMFGAMVNQFAYLFGGTPPKLTLSHDNVNQLFVIYGAGFVAMCGSIVLLNLHAWNRRDSLRLNALEQFDTRAEINAWAIVGGAGLVSIALALAMPEGWANAALPGWTYSLLAIIMPLYGRWSDRRRLALLRCKD